MTYHMLLEELNKIQLDHSFEVQQELDNWFLALADKLKRMSSQTTLHASTT